MRNRLSIFVHPSLLLQWINATWFCCAVSGCHYNEHKHPAGPCKTKRVHKLTVDGFGHPLFHHTVKSAN